MKTGSLPTLQYPFPDLIHPHVHLAEAHVKQWISGYKSVPGNARLRYACSFIGDLAARLYPDGSYDTLLAAARHLLLFFVLDDLSDHLDEQELQMLASQVLLLLNGEETPQPDQDIFHQFALLRNELLALSTQSWMQRYLDDVRHYFSGVLEGAFFNPKQHRSLLPFLASQKKIAGLYKLLDLAELSAGFILPADLAGHPFTTRLRYLAVRIMAACSDYYSFPVTEDDGIVPLLQLHSHDHQYPLLEALEKVVQYHNEDLEAFLQLTDHIPDMGAYNEGLHRYIISLGLMIQGHKSWYGCTHQYES